LHAFIDAFILRNFDVSILFFPSRQWQSVLPWLHLLTRKLEQRRNFGNSAALHLLQKQGKKLKLY